MPTQKVVEYLEPNGSSPFTKWFGRLDPAAAAKVATALYRMEQGNLSNVKPVGQGVAEYRIDFGPQDTQEVNSMPITRKFRETVWARAQDDARFRAAMLSEAINELLTGDLDAAKAMLRDYVNATITFDGLAKETGKPNKSLQRMLSPRGNPTAESLFAIIKVLQGSARIRLAVTSKRAA